MSSATNPTDVRPSRCQRWLRAATIASLALLIVLGLVAVWGLSQHANVTLPLGERLFVSLIHESSQGVPPLHP